ncbi:XRE family transcriptional regulator [Streptomyces albidoflavus]|uniref:MmyB family transcriptional regulator n=1 Tax=Streptomyces albidoflavus TaxID=1886 RepID=UPI0033C3EFE0
MHTRKKALQALLQERRALIDPTTHGLTRPTGSGRRAPGLSQQQVDILTSRAIGTYHRLESGIYKHPPSDLLQAVAQLLSLTEQEWVALYRYARAEDPPAPLYPQSGHQVPGVWQTAVDGITHMAYVTDASWGLLACNSQFAELFPQAEAPDNTMRWMLWDGREHLTDWATDWAPFVLPQLRAALAARPDDPTLQAIERDVHADPELNALYTHGSTGYIHPDGDERPIRHAVLGDGWVTMCAAQPMAAPGARLVILVFHPGPERAHARTPMLRAR